MTFRGLPDESRPNVILSQTEQTGLPRPTLGNRGARSWNQRQRANGGEEMRQSQRIDGPVWSVGGHGTTTHRVCKTTGYKIRGIFLKTCRLGASLDLPELWGIVDGLGITGGRCQLEKAGLRMFGTGLLRIGEGLGDGAWRGLRGGWEGSFGRATSSSTTALAFVQWASLAWRWEPGRGGGRT